MAKLAEVYGKDLSRHAASMEKDGDCPARGGGTPARANPGGAERAAAGPFPHAILVREIGCARIGGRLPFLSQRGGAGAAVPKGLCRY